MAPDTPDDRALAGLVPLPLVLGLLESVAATLTSWLERRGCAVVALEGGRNGTSASIANLDSALWLFIAGVGLIAPNRLPGIADHRARLARARGDLPAVIHVHHRRSVCAADGFVMEPNFTNLQHIRKGQLLARDKRGEIRAEEDGILVLPVYQQQGDDAFFLGTEHE
jgi:succinylglutamate desuccinylase